MFGAGQRSLPSHSWDVGRRFEPTFPSFSLFVDLAKLVALFRSCAHARSQETKRNFESVHVYTCQSRQPAITSHVDKWFT